MLNVYMSYVESKQILRLALLVCQKEYKETVLLGLHTLTVLVSGLHWSDSARHFVKREGGQQRYREVGLCWMVSRLRGPGI